MLRARSAICRLVRLELPQIGAVDDELDVCVLRAAASDSGHRSHARAEVRGGEKGQDGLPDILHDGELIALALVKILQSHVERRVVARAVLIVRHCHQRVGHFRQLLTDGRRHTVGDELGHLEAGAFRCAQADLELRLIVDRNEVLVRQREERHAREQDQERQRGDHSPMIERPPQQPGVRGIDWLKESRVLRPMTLALWCPLEPASGQRRRQGEAHEQ